MLITAGALSKIAKLGVVTVRDRQ